MAYAMTKQGSRANTMTYEFMCDTIADMNLIENEYKTLGSIAIVLQGESDGLEVYICNSNLQWTALNTGSAQPSGSGGNSSLSIHVCAQNEIDNGLPDVASPDENTIYLVPAGNTSGNLYEEYIYVNDDWEKFGAASIDLSNYATLSDIAGFYTKPSGGIPAADLAETYLTAHQDISNLATKSEIPDTSIYAPKASPVFTGSISLGRKANTTVGDWSTTLGVSNTASGTYSVAEGSGTSATGPNSHAEGVGTIASGTGAHAEGMGGILTINGQNINSAAIGTADHVEGYLTRTAPGMPGNHAEGYQTAAIGGASHAEGESTTASGIDSHAEGKVTEASGPQSHAEGYSTIARQSGAHAEGNVCYAYREASHAEGEHTEANGIATHAEGSYTSAQADYAHVEGWHTQGFGRAVHVGGKYNSDDFPIYYPIFAANTAYEVGDIVVNSSYTIIYKCKTAHTSASTIDTSKWDKVIDYDYAEIIGNGSDRYLSNARALTWTGDERLAGNLYVNCNADSTGGNKVISEADYATSSTAGVVKIGTTNTGLYLNPTSGILFISPAETDELKAGTNTNKPIVPAQEHEATFYGLAKAAGDSTQAASNNAVGTYTDDAKAAIRNMLGVEDNFTRNNVNRIVSLGTIAIDGTEKTTTLNIRLLQEGTAQLVIDSNATTIHLTKSTADNKIYYTSTETLQDGVTPILTLYHDSSATASATVTYQITSDTIYSEQKEIALYYPSYYISTVGIQAFVTSAKTGYLVKLLSTEDIATDITPGAVKVNAGHGIAIDSDGVLQLTTPTASQLQALSNGWLAPRLNTMHTAIFYGLAKAAGDTTQSISTNAVGLYTDNAKAAIKSMLGLPIPTAPVADGTYNLQVSVSDGTAIYNWVSTGA